MKYKAKLPSQRQAGIQPEVYDLLSANPHCARLMAGECSEPCEKIIDGEYSVDLDHIVPKSTGGPDSIDNLQWLCSTKNREKYNKPEPRYSGRLYFDQNIDTAKLRRHQLDLGYGRVVSENGYKSIFENPNDLIKRFMVLAWMVGSGKTVGMLSILFGINRVRSRLGNGSAKRIKKVLWMVHQKTLVTSLKKEIEEDLVNYKIADSRPTVVAITDGWRWKTPADVVVCCPQALWDSRANNLNDDMRREILSEFDAIVVDEAHFGVDKYLEIARLAPLAFKFAVTATPMDGNGKMFCDMNGGSYKPWFALFSSFGYRPGYEAGIYKELLPFEEGKDTRYIAISGGEAVRSMGGDRFTESDVNDPKSIVRKSSIIRNALNKAAALDHMTGYNNHIMVRAGGINEVKGLVKSLDNYGVCGVWAGSGGANLGSEDHPWMLAKNHDGIMPKEGKRTVICIDIGQFGINNKYCSIIVWIAANNSLVEIIQRIGRAIRGTKPGAFVVLMWDHALDSSDPSEFSFAQRLKEAIDWMLNSEPKMKSFLSMYELKGDVPDITLNPVGAAVKTEDRSFIQELMGEALLVGEGIPEAATSSVERFIKETPGVTDDYAEKLTRYAESLTTEDGRAKAGNYPECLKPTSITLEEKAPENYTIDRLISAVEHCEVSPHLDRQLRAKKIKRMEDGDDLTIAEVDGELRRQDEITRELDDVEPYHPKHIWGASEKDKAKMEAPLPFDSYAQELAKMFVRAFGGNYFEAFQAAKQAGLTGKRGAIAERYGLKDCAEKSYTHLLKPLSAALCQDSERRIIIARARYLMIERCKDKVPGMYELFKSQYLRSGE